MAVGRSRKRYVLFSSSRATDAESRKGLVELMLARHPSLERKKMVWVEHGLIVRTDVTRLAEVKGSPPLRLGDVTLTAARTSGSISKLKRMVPDGSA